MKQTPASSRTLNPPRDGTRREYGRLRTSWFDCVTSMLTAIMLFLGTLVFVLAVLWTLSDPSTTFDDPTPSNVSWGTVDARGLERDFLEPGADEVVELNQPDMQASLLAVTDAVSRVVGREQSGLDVKGGQSGKGLVGHSRPPGPPTEVVPRFQRWQLEFTAKDIDAYARQLDHYKIELGLIGGAIQGVDYATALSTRPTLRRGESGSEKRLYFMWSRPSPLAHFDRQLLRRAGALLEGREMLKFIPPELENQLSVLELEYASARQTGQSRNRQPSLSSITKTIFTSQAAGDGYQFVVSEQRYQKPND